MTAAELLERVRLADYRVELVFAPPVRKLVAPGRPALVKLRHSDVNMPDDLVRDLKVNRDKVIRHLTFVHLLAQGKPIWGYDSDVGRPAHPMKLKGFPPEWDRVCCDGDEFWIAVPKESKQEK